MNHERSVAVVHPLMFLLRRVIYALTIIFFIQNLLFGVLITQAICMAMLAYALYENQWNESVINWQHIGNEIVIYTLCVILMLFNGTVDAQIRYHLGWVLCYICLAYIVLNSIVILFYSARLIRLLFRHKYPKKRSQRQMEKESRLAIKSLD